MTDQNNEFSRIGIILKDGTEVLKPLASGGQGTVYIGRDSLGRKVAVKFMDCSSASGTRTWDRFRTRFFQEAQMTASLHHPVFPQIFGIDKENEAIVMELIEGDQFRDVLRIFTSEEQRRYIPAFCNLAEGLAKAHADKIVHRDIKPENLIQRTTERGKIILRLIDLGIAKEFRQQDASTDITIVGTPDYMSPEQFYDALKTNRQTDQYALGCVIFEIFTGEQFIMLEVDDADIQKKLFLHASADHRDFQFGKIQNSRKRALVELLMAIKPEDRLGGMLEVIGALKLLDRQLEIEEVEQIHMDDRLEELKVVMQLCAAKKFGGQWEQQGALKLLYRQWQSREGVPQTAAAPAPQEFYQPLQEDPDESVPTEQAVADDNVHPVNSAQVVAEARVSNTGNYPPPVRVTSLGSPPEGHPLKEAGLSLSQRRDSSDADETIRDLPELPYSAQKPKRKVLTVLTIIGLLCATGLTLGVWYFDSSRKPSKSAQPSTLATKSSMKSAMHPVIKARRIPSMRPAPVIVRIKPRTPPKSKLHPYDVLKKKCPPRLCKHTTGEEAWIRKQATKLKDPCMALRVFRKMKKIYTVKFVKDKTGKRVWNVNYVGKKQKWGIKWAIKGRPWTPGRLAYKGYIQRCKEHKAAQKANP